MTSVSRSLLVLALLLGCGSHDRDDDDDDRVRHHSRAEPEVERPSHVREVPEAPPIPGEIPRPSVLTTAQISATSSRCDAGGARECWLLGAMNERGEGRAVDMVEAQRLYERACGLAGGFGCDDLARLDEANAPAHLAVGCDAGRTNACAALGTIDPARLQRACTLGDVESCVGVTRVVRDATPVPAGTPTEISRLPQAVTDATLLTAARRCDDGIATMCAWLAFQYVEEGPLGVPVDEEHALELSRRACNDTALGGCLLVGEILVTRGQGVATAGTAFNRSCAAGNAEACDAIATVLTGLPEAQNEIALARFEACVLGIDEDCSHPR